MKGNEKHMAEIWKPVVGFEGYYEVSTMGNVRSLDRDVPDSKGRIQHRKGQNLAPALVRRYLCVALCKDGKQTTQRVSRLVCQAFLPEYSEELTVDHINGNVLDNRVENLQCLSRRVNIRKSWQDGTRSKQKKPITLKRISDGRVFEFESHGEAARELNVSHGTLWRAEQNNWKVKGYKILKV